MLIAISHTLSSPENCEEIYNIFFFFPLRTSSYFSEAITLCWNINYKEFYQSVEILSLELDRLSIVNTYFSKTKNASKFGLKKNELYNFSAAKYLLLVMERWRG